MRVLHRKARGTFAGDGAARKDRANVLMPFGIVRVVVVAALALAVPAGAAFAGNPFPFGKGLVPEKYQAQMTRPFGVSFVYTWISEELAVSDFGLALNGQPIPPAVVALSGAKHTTNVELVRGDVWVLPFVNVSGVVGHLSGNASELGLRILPGMFPTAGIKPDTKVAYSGTIAGVGVVFAAGVGPAFASYDYNRTWTKVDVLSERVSTTNQALRVGFKRRVGTGNRVSAYTGAFRESISGTQAGTGAFEALLPGLTADYTLKARPRHAWNPVLGVNIEITSHFAIVAEGGFGGRHMFVLMPSVRF